MIKTLIFYDNVGHIFLQMSGSYELPQGGIQFIEIEVPEGKIISKIDTTTTPHSPIFEEMQKTEIEKVKSDTELLKGCVMELANIVYS